MRECNVKELNQRKAERETRQLISGDLRYLGQRGVDFSKSWVDGASINGAHISRLLSSAELPAEEILLFVTHGTRMRYKK